MPADWSEPAPGAAAPLEVGALAPDFVLPDASGRTHRLAEFRGSVVVLAFNPPHWDPARAEQVEAYNRLIRSLPGLAGARLLDIAADGGPWRELTFADAALSVPVLAGDTDAVARDYGVAGTPAVFVVDGDGRVRWRHVAVAGALPHPDDLARALAAFAPAANAADLDEESGREETRDDRARGGCTRREFVATALGASLALLLAPAVASAERVDRAARNDATDLAVPATVPVTLRVNGRDVALRLEPRVTLLDALREYAGLTGSKKGCDHGQCGACTVHVDGRRTLSCLTLAVMQQGKEITTIEGLATGAGDDTAALHPMQRAFLTHDGFQCGYCTPGQIMSAVAMVREPWGPDDADVREAMSGNLCRCGAYLGIVAAIQEVRRASNAPTPASTPSRGRGA